MRQNQRITETNGLWPHESAPPSRHSSASMAGPLRAKAEVTLGRKATSRDPPAPPHGLYHARCPTEPTAAKRAARPTRLREPSLQLRRHCDDRSKPKGHRVAPSGPPTARSSSKLGGDLRTPAPGAYLPPYPHREPVANRHAARAARRPDLMDKPSLQTSRGVLLRMPHARIRCVPVVRAFHRAVSQNDYRSPPHPNSTTIGNALFDDERLPGFEPTPRKSLAFRQLGQRCMVHTRTLS